MSRISRGSPSSSAQKSANNRERNRGSRDTRHHAAPYLGAATTVPDGQCDVGQFLPARHAPRSKRLRMGIEAIVQQAIDQHYAQQRRPSLTSLADEIAGRSKAAGLPVPSDKAIRARVRARDQVWLVRRREGWRKARSLRLLTGADAGATRHGNGSRWTARPCDIRLVREHDRTVIGRPNVTFAIDVYSRTTLGFSVSLQSASTVTVATCLARACAETGLARAP